MSASLRLGDLLPANVARGLSPEIARLSIAGMASDSRNVVNGDLFLALPGTRDDGRRHIAAAARAGAIAALAESGDDIANSHEWIPVVAVDAVRTVAGEIADRFFGSPTAQLTLTGVTGTNGKTTVTLLLAQLIELLGSPCAVLGTVGRGFPNALCAGTLTTADVVANHRALAELVAAGARYAAMEVSSHALDQERVAGLRIAVAVFTNLTRDHLDYHGTMASYQAAKARLFTWPGLVARVINIDDAAGRELAQYSGARLWTYSVDDATADVYFSQLRQDALGTHGVLTTPSGCIAVETMLLGRFNAANIAAVVAAALAQGFPVDAIGAALPHLRGAPGRMTQYRRADGALAVVDYAHTPDGLIKALQALKEIASGKLICVFGCGGDRDRGKRPLMAEAADALADTVVLTDDNPRNEDPAQIFRDVLAHPPRGARWHLEHDRRAAIAHALGIAGADDIVLVAGKGHEDYQDSGGVKRPFSDALIVAELIARWRA